MRDPRISLAAGLVLFLLALGTRAVSLGAFAWPDELTWLERSSAFILAVERGDPAGTYLADHPGVVPMWGFGAALYLRAALTDDRDALEALAAGARRADSPDEAYPAEMPPLLATAAWFTAVCTSLTVVGAYALAIPLLGRAGAALAGLFVALDPFLLSQSRIVHVDALLAGFMLLAVLSLLVYLQQPARRRYLLLSGLMAGLALLTKTPSLFLIPLTLLALGVQWVLRRTGRAGWGSLPQAAGAFALWLATMAGTFIALWPAAWLRPWFFFYRLYRASRWAGIESHGSNFFLGRAVEDPGPLFYWVVLPFRLSPVVFLLLPLSLALLILAWRRRDAGAVRLPAVGLSFLLFFTVMVSLAAKKGDRYLLPVFPVAGVVAAWAWMALLGQIRRPSWVREHRAFLGMAVVLLASALWLPLSPYYGAYFNPLVGGGPAAERAFPFGQGEGLDLAARYLNQKENPQDLLVVSFYPQQFRYYFDGMVTSLRRGDWDGTWLFADYAVFYISQRQRGLPSPELVAFFAGQQPEYTARLGGVDFARVYRSPVLLSGRPPAVERRLDGVALGPEGELRLVGYALGAERPRPGQPLDVTLYWQAQAQLGADYYFRVRWAGDDGRVVWEQAGPPFEGRFPTSWWRPGHTMLDRYRIALPEALPPGRYWLVVSAYKPGDVQALAPQGPADARWPGAVALGPVWVE